MISSRLFLAFLALLALFGFAYYFEVYLDAKKEQAKLSYSKILSVKKDKIGTITIKKKGYEIFLEKKGSHWFIEKPISYLASQDEVESLFNTLLDMKKNDELRPTDYLSPLDYGISSESPEIILSMDDGKKIKLRMGKKAPIDYAQYISVGKDDNIILADTVLNYIVDKEVDQYRERRLFVSDADKPVAVSIATKEYDLELTYEGDQWKVKGPKRDVSYDESEISLLGSSLEKLKKAEFLDVVSNKIKERIKKTEELARFKIADKGGDLKVLHIGPKKENNYMALLEPKDEVFLLSEYDVKSILKTPDELRKKAIFSISRDEVNEIGINRYVSKALKKAIKIQKTRDGGYRIVEDKKAKDSKIDLAMFVDDLLNVKARSFISKPSEHIEHYGLDDPDFKITIKTKKVSLTDIKVKQKKEAGGVKTLMLLSDKDIIYEIDPFLLDRLKRLTEETEVTK